MTPRLEARALRRSYGPTRALDGVDLDVRPGEIHSVLGENGAGKSTLMRALFGLTRPDAGSMQLDGQPYAPKSPADALAAGVGMVHQHFMLVPAFRVWENLWLARPRPGGFDLPRAEARRRVEELSERFGLELEPDAFVEDLPVGARQRLEIAKALSRDVRVLILDEPTAVLAPGEVESLVRVLRALREEGVSVLFISHKLDEVLEVSDRITVLRRGRVTARCDASDADVPRLRHSIVGDGTTEWARREPRRIEIPPEEPEPDRAAGEIGDSARRVEPREPGEPRLVVKGLSTTRAGRVPLRDVSFRLRAGEIVGLTGVDGNGQEELVATLAGLAAVERGTIRIGARDATRWPPRERWREGLSVLPGDRQRDGVVAEAPLWENLALREFGASWARRGWFVAVDRHLERARELIERHDIRASGPLARAAGLSGGNQQKLLLARELAAGPRVLVFANPTRGLDIAAADSFLREAGRLRDAGAAVLLVSTELDEVLAHSDRVAVLSRGRWLEPEAATREAVSRCMLGGDP